MDCHLLLEDRTGYTDPAYTNSGNVLLDVLHGATYEMRGPDLDMHAEMEAVADQRRATGESIYTIPGGGSNATGALGYVNCAFELLAQANDRSLKLDHVVHATGSAGTQAGLVVGLKAMNASLPLLGIGVRAPQPKQEIGLRRCGGAC